MSYSSTDARIANLLNHVIQYKLELLRPDAGNIFVTISEITTSAENVTFNIDSSSDIRRTSTMTLLVENEDWLTENFEIGWLDKLVRFSIGVQYRTEPVQALVDTAVVGTAKINATSDGWIWYTLGTMLLTSDAFTFDATTRQLELSLVDLMACATAERGSQIGPSIRYNYETNIAQMLAATIARFLPFKQTQIEEFPDVLPYDMTFGGGQYPYDILSTVLALFPWYEQYFSNDGVYHAGQLPMRLGEPCLLTHEDIDDLIIAEHRNFNFSNIKNTTEIIGKSIKADYTASNCTFDSSTGTYTLGFLLSMSTLEPNAKYCFTPDADSPAAPKIKITLTDAEQGEQDTATLYDSEGNALEAGRLTADYAYVVRCVALPEDDGNGNVTVVKKFYLMGRKQIHVIVREMNLQPSAATIAADKLRNDCMDIEYVINADSPYACDRQVTVNGVTSRLSIEAGEIRQVLYDGEYASIYTTELAYQRGEYENYLKCRMNTDVELETVLIPFIEVNQKIEYTSPATHEVRQYIVKSVVMDVSRFTMRMQLARFYDYYPYSSSAVASADQETVQEGDRVILRAYTTGITGSVTYQWQFTNTPDNESSWSNSVLPGAGTKTLSFTADQTRVDGRYYRCVVTKQSETWETNAVTVVWDSTPNVIATVNRSSAGSGDTVTFSAAVYGFSDTPTYQWQFSNTPQTASSWSNTTLSGNSTATLSFSATQTRVSGRYYRCKVTSGNDTYYSNAVGVAWISGS